MVVVWYQKPSSTPSRTLALPRSICTPNLDLLQPLSSPHTISPVLKSKNFTKLDRAVIALPVVVALRPQEPQWESGRLWPGLCLCVILKDQTRLMNNQNEGVVHKMLLGTVLLECLNQGDRPMSLALSYWFVSVFVIKCQPTTNSEPFLQPLLSLGP